MRTQIALSPEQHARVRRKATELGISMAEYIRRLVDQDFATARTHADLTSIIGLFDSGSSDIANEGTQATRAAIAERAARKKI
ncbi:MAG: hypothetical protein OXS33_03640 [bacterium]|nr:hypothetical protein [bacterium]MDE0501608.1 hypothetical protein [bacterium]